MDFRDQLHARLAERRAGRLDIRSDLLHFALITYALPVERLRPHIPQRFEIPTFSIGGRLLGLMSVVPFVDQDFRYYRLLPFFKWRFSQTNYRVYVVDRQSGEHCVWFFGTTISSPIVYLARWLWRIPWHYARYQVDCEFNRDAGRYDRYCFSHQGPWATAEVELADTGRPMERVEGFDSLEAQALVLTHPVEGYFYRTDGRVGTYSVWHEPIPLTIGRARRLYFSLYDRLGLLSGEEMQHPHSILICPHIAFEVHLPPKRA